MLGLLQHHGPPHEYREVIGCSEAGDTFRVTSPLQLPPVVAPQQLSLFAARADRLIPIAVPRSGTGLTHVGFTWSRAARGVLAARMRDALGRGCS